MQEKRIRRIPVIDHDKRIVARSVWAHIRAQAGALNRRGLAMGNAPQADWQQHTTGNGQCGRCPGGFPYPCPCGGRVHGELLGIPNNGFIQLMRCECCEGLADPDAVP